MIRCSIYKASPSMRYLEWSREWIKYLQGPPFRSYEASWLAQIFLSGIFLTDYPQKYVLEAQKIVIWCFLILGFSQKWNLLALCIEQVHDLYRVSDDRSERVTWRNEMLAAMKQEDWSYVMFIKQSMLANLSCTRILCFFGTRPSKQHLCHHARTKRLSLQWKRSI